MSAAAMAATAGAALDFSGTAAALSGLAAGGTSLATIGSYASLASSVIGGIGSLTKGMAGSQSAKYNAAIASQNASIAQQNAQRASMAGEQAAAMKERQTRANVGQIEANQAASGIDVNKGSAPDVRSSAAMNGELDAITIRSNAARDAYGYQTDSAKYTGEAALHRSEAGYDAMGGYIDTGTTILGGVGNAGLKYQAYQNAGGL
jgi:hypothetical protein